MSLDSSGTGSETPSEEDYDENVRPVFDTKREAPQQQVHRRKAERRVSKGEPLFAPIDPTIVRDGSGRIRFYPENDQALRELLKRTSESAKYPGKDGKPRRKFRDHLFTHQFSAFDPHNVAAVNSPFHGFYTLFWLAVGLFVLKISVINWRTHGTPLGSNEIMMTMFHRDGRPTMTRDLESLTLITVLGSHRPADLGWNDMWTYRRKLAHPETGVPSDS
jgi:sterol O-acyltransferase